MFIGVRNGMSEEVLRPKKLRRKKRRSRNVVPVEPPVSFARETWSILLTVLAFFIVVSLYSYYQQKGLWPKAEQSLPDTNFMGSFGLLISEYLVMYFGYCSAFVALIPLIVARRIWIEVLPSGLRLLSTILGILFSAALLSLATACFAAVLLGPEGGGILGLKAAAKLLPYINQAGTLLLSFTLIVISFEMCSGLGVARALASLREQIGHTSLTDVARTVASFFGRQTAKVFVQIFIFLRARLRSFVLHLKAELGFLSDEEMERKLAYAAAVDETEEDYWELGQKIEESNGTHFSLSRDSVEAEQAKEQQEVYSKQKLQPGSVGTSFHQQIKRARVALGRMICSSSELEDFQLPTLDLLVPGVVEKRSSALDVELRRNSKRLEQVLADFRIGGQIVDAQPGPVITLYEFEPPPGVKVQRVVSLADDIALALKVSSVRVYAPVPGKGTIGIEVPNQDRAVVRLRDVLCSSEFNDLDSSLTLALGKDTLGTSFATDLARMPHLLIAGATGTGKSVGINSMLLSLLYRHSPKALRLILIDPKMLELSLYEDIPHLLAPVVTNPKRARGVLWWAVEEMDRRYRLMKELGVRNIASYNRSVLAEKTEEEQRQVQVKARGTVEPEVQDDEPSEVIPLIDSIQHEVLPRIVIVVDEFADLMFTVGREVEELFARLAQKARAAGIHLIIATQRPSVNVITGIIKANFPARISYKVASRIDARTVLDISGAERLLGEGDLLFLSPISGRVKRLHGAFVSDEEVQHVVEILKQQAPPDYDPAIEAMIKRLEESESGGGLDISVEADYDPLYDKALQLVLEKGFASTSMVQRAFRIGYNRAARIVEMMEREGIVGPADGARPRQVLHTQP